MGKNPILIQGLTFNRRKYDILANLYIEWYKQMYLKYFKVSYSFNMIWVFI